MKSRSDFLKQKPSRRTEMVLDGYDHITAHFDSLAAEIGILNSWLQLMPDLIVNGKAPVPLDDSWEKKIDWYVASGDSLTAAMVENVKHLEQFSKAILLRKNKSTSTTL